MRFSVTAPPAVRVIATAAALGVVLAAPAVRAEAPEEALRPAPVELAPDAATRDPATPIVPHDDELAPIDVRPPPRPVLDEIPSNGQDTGKILRPVYPLLTDLDVDLGVFAVGARTTHARTFGTAPIPDATTHDTGLDLELIGRTRAPTAPHIRLGYRELRASPADGSGAFTRRDVHLLAGARLDVGAVAVHPEVGIEVTSSEPSPSSARSAITAATVPAALLGAWLQLPLTGAVTADVELHAVSAVSSGRWSDRRMLGARLHVALRIMLVEGLAIVPRWASSARWTDLESSRTTTARHDERTEIEHGLSIGAVVAI